MHIVYPLSITLYVFYDQASTQVIKDNSSRAEVSRELRNLNLSFNIINLWLRIRVAAAAAQIGRATSVSRRASIPNVVS